MQAQADNSDLVLNFASCEVDSNVNDNSNNNQNFPYSTQATHNSDSNNNSCIQQQQQLSKVNYSFITGQYNQNVTEAVVDVHANIQQFKQISDNVNQQKNVVNTPSNASDIDLSKISSKREAKKLGQVLYKQWKKIEKKRRMHNDRYTKQDTTANNNIDIDIDDDDDDSEKNNNNNNRQKYISENVKEQSGNILQTAQKMTSTQVLTRKAHKRHRSKSDNVHEDDDNDNDNDNDNDDSVLAQQTITEKEADSKQHKHRHHRHHHKSKHASRHEHRDKHKRHHHRRKHSNHNEEKNSQFVSANNNNNEGDDNNVSIVAQSEFANFAHAQREAAQHKARRREDLLRQASSLTAAKTLTPRQATAKVHEMAKNLVEAMRNARAKDDLILSRNARLSKTSVNTSNTNSNSVHSTGTNSLPPALPLNKIALKATVQAQCQRSFLIGPLIEAGILQELSYWLYDFDRNEPAAYELRTTALDILIHFPIEGELENVPGRRSRNGDEDLTVFTGIDRQHLIHTDVGRAVNALRLHSSQIAQNRSKCVQLLQRLSRAMSGGVRTNSYTLNRSVDFMDDHVGLTRSGANGLAQSAAATTVLWQQKGLRGIASPFNFVQTSSQAFQKAFAKPDPRDPASYHNLLPWRQPVRAITNLSGRLANQIVQPELHE